MNSYRLTELRAPLAVIRCQLDVTTAGKIKLRYRAGRIDVRTDTTVLSGFRGNGVSVDFTITVPASVSVEAHSVTGDVKVSNVQGVVRAETVSGSITLVSAPRVELAKSVSGDVDITGLSIDGDASANTESGEIRAKGGRALLVAPDCLQC